jgi:hypothetical protein
VLTVLLCKKYSNETAALYAALYASALLRLSLAAAAATWLNGFFAKVTVAFYNALCKAPPLLSWQ